MMRAGSGTSQTRGTRTDRHGGFTLIELIIVLAIAVLLLGLGVPSFQALRHAGEANASMLRLRGMLQLARSEAIANSTEVTFCGTLDDTRCNREWYGKTLVFIDANRNRRLDAGEHVVTVESVPIRGTLRWRASGGRHYLRFRPEGSVKEFGTLLYCPPDTDPIAARALIISHTGRPRSSVDRDGDGVREDSSGRPLTCD